jgi:hypothetical protein
VQHEVVAPAGNRDRVELDRPEATEDLENPVGAAVERPRWREKVAGNEKTACGLGGDPHPEDASYRDMGTPGRTEYYANRFDSELIAPVLQVG